jgi:hypothetical protein
LPAEKTAKENPTKAYNPLQSGREQEAKVEDRRLTMAAEE